MLTLRCTLGRCRFGALFRDIHVDGGRKVGHQLRIIPCDRHNDHEGAKFIGKVSAFADGCQLVEFGREYQIRIGIEPHFCRLPDLQAWEVLLVRHHAHLHGRRIYDLHERNARTHLVSFLHLSHGPLLPDSVQHDDSVEGRTDLHEVGIGLSVQHGLLRAIALNFQDANRRLCGFAFQVKGFTKLPIGGFGFVEVFLVFFRIDARYDFRLLYFQFRLAKIVLGLFEFGLILCPCRTLLSLLFGLLVDKVPHLGLPVKFHQQISLFDAGPSRNHPDDGKCGNLLSCEQRRKYGSRLHRFGCSLKP